MAIYLSLWFASGVGPDNAKRKPVVVTVWMPTEITAPSASGMRIDAVTTGAELNALEKVTVPVSSPLPRSREPVCPLNEPPPLPVETAPGAPLAATITQFFSLSLLPNATGSRFVSAVHRTVLP